MARSSGSGRSVGGLREIVEEPAETPSVSEEGSSGEDKLYVAVAREFKEGKATLIWALQHSSPESKIVIAHVHRPAQMIPFMGAKFAASQLTKEQVRAHRQIEREKIDKSLQEYLDLCSVAKRRADKLVTEKDDIGKGLVEMISLHGVNKLVMGAAADKQYSRKMKVPKSKTAITVQQQADCCKIWFVCKGNLIFTRDAGLDYVFAHSPARTSSPMSSQSEQLRSRSLPQRQAESINWLLSPVHEILKRRSKSVSLASPEGEIIAVPPVVEHVTTSSTVTEVNAFDPWDSVSRTSRASDQSSCFASSDEALVNIGPVLPMLEDEANKEELFTLHLVHEPDEDLQFSSTRIVLEDVGMDDEVYEKLQHALAEAENLKHEAYEESRRRQKAERDSIEISRKARTSENLYTKELNRRKEIEETLAREMVELENLKNQRDEVFEELQKAHDQESELKLRIAESDCVVRDLDEKLSAAHHLLNSLQQEREELQLERENAVREVQELRQRRDEGASDFGRAANFSEFSYTELEQATNMFDESMKIGEGGYGSVYKGFLRHTTVAIKMLNPQSMQGQSEFYQEVNVLGRVRHPHLVTLIGTCPEARALVYEYCANGNLEDRLLCKDNSSPLTWQVRTRIAAEICSALIFLHSNTPHSVVHGDLKTANILIDANFVSKLGDFGICRLLVQSNTSTLYCHTQPKGTFGYIDPEFIASGVLTPGSDVYSFGVILLCLLTGRPALGLAKEVQEALNAGCLDQIVDPIAGDWPFVQAKQLAHLALRCCEMKRNARPDLIGEAWKVLEAMSKAASRSGLSSFTSGPAPDGNSCIPSYFLCPIFQEIMTDPHIAADGFTYELEALKGWLDSGHDTSPMTNIKLPHHQLIPNRALRSAIQEWLQQYT